MKNNSALWCSDKIMVDSNGNLQVIITATNTCLSVPDNLLNNNAQNITFIIKAYHQSLLSLRQVLLLVLVCLWL